MQRMQHRMQHRRWHLQPPVLSMLGLQAKNEIQERTPERFSSGQRSYRGDRLWVFNQKHKVTTYGIAMR